MTVSWNQWHDTALAKPQAGQIRTNDEEQVIRAKRPFGSNRTSVEKLDARRSPADIAKNQKSLQDIKASLSDQFGAEVGAIVYQQLFQSKESWGRPISSSEIIVADALGKQLHSGQKWLLNHKLNLPSDIATQAFRKAFEAPLPLTDGKLTSETVSERINSARDLALNLQNDQAFVQSKAHYLELFAATPASVIDDKGQVTRPREELRARLLEVAQKPQEMDDPRMPVDQRLALSDRTYWLTSLIPTPSQLEALEHVDAQAGQYAALIAGEVHALRDLQTAEMDRDGIEIRLAGMDQEIAAAQNDLTGAENTISDLQAKLLVAQTEKSDCERALSVAETAANERPFFESLIKEMDQELARLEDEVQPFRSKYEALNQELNSKLEAMHVTKDKAWKKVNEKTIEPLKAHIFEALQSLAQKEQEIDFRSAAVRDKRAFAEYRLQNLPAAVPGQGQLEALKQRLDLSNSVVQGIEIEQRLSQMALESAKSQLEDLRQVKLELPQRLEQAQALVSHRAAVLEDCKTQVRDFGRNAPAEVRDMLKVRAQVMSLERGRLQPRSISDQDLQNAHRFLSLKVLNTPRDSQELPALNSALEMAQDELLARWMMDRESVSTGRVALNNEGVVKIKAGEPKERVVIDTLKAMAALTDNLLDKRKFLEGGTNVAGKRHPHPAALVAQALGRIREGMSARDAADAALQNGSEANQLGMIDMLEKRQQAVAAGLLEPRVFDEASAQLLETLKVQQGLYGGLLSKTLILQGTKLKQLQEIQKSLQAAVSGYTERLEFEKAQVVDAQQQAERQARKRDGILSGLRHMFSIGRSEVVALKDATRKAEAQENLLQAIDEVSTTEEKLKESRLLLERVTNALRAAADPANERALVNLIRMGVLHRENRLANEEELDRAVVTLRENAAAAL